MALLFRDVFMNFTKNFGNIIVKSYSCIATYIYLKALFLSQAQQNSLMQLFLVKSSPPSSYYRPWTQHSIMNYILVASYQHCV